MRPGPNEWGFALCRLSLVSRRRRHQSGTALRGVRLAPLVLFLTLFMPVSSAAITAVERSFSELAHLAEVIVVGTVAEGQSLQLPGGAIVTRHLLKVSRVLKGNHDPGFPLIVQVLGGKVGDVELSIAGAPSFLVGERVLLFVRGNVADAFPFVGVQQGVFKLVWDQTSGIERVLDWRRRPVVGFRDGTVAIDPEARLTEAVRLDDFTREIEWALGR